MFESLFSGEGNKKKREIIERNHDFVERKLVDYLLVPPDMYNKIPVGAHIRYVTYGPEPYEARFNTGGFVKMKWLHKKTNKPMMKLTYKRDSFGDARDEHCICLDNVVEVYKKHHYESIIEIKALMATIEIQQKQINELLSSSPPSPPQ